MTLAPLAFGQWSQKQQKKLMVDSQWWVYQINLLSRARVNNGDSKTTAKAFYHHADAWRSLKKIIKKEGRKETICRH